MEEKYSRLINTWEDIVTIGSWLKQTNCITKQKCRRELGNEHWIFDGIREFFLILLGLNIVPEYLMVLGNYFQFF